MQVLHPSEPFNNIAPENVFLAINDLGVQCGYGYVTYQYQPGVYPDCPVNIYFKLESTPEAEYMLYGALIAHARQMRQRNPNDMARIYTDVPRGDDRRMNFFLYNKMTIENVEEVYRLQIPEFPGVEQFNTKIVSVDPTQINAYDLARRLQDNGMGHISPVYIQQLSQTPNFHLLGMMYGGNGLIAECIVAGSGSSAEVMAIYVVPGFRQKGLGKQLLHHALALLGEEGVTDVTARIMSASQPQVRLIQSFGGELKDQLIFFPGLKV